jgi:hypothetical protein
MGAETAVQKALFDALTAVPLRVYDAAPQDADGGSVATFPYVEIGFISLTEMDDKATNGFEFLARVHTRSRSASMLETKEIQGRIYAALHYAELPMVGQRLVLLRRETSLVQRAADQTFHGVCEYRGLIETT